MILIAFACFALLIVAWLLAPGLERSTAPSATMTETAADPLPAAARI